MSRTFWNHSGHAAFVMFASMGIMTASLHAYCESGFQPTTSFLPDISSQTMSNEELLETATAFNDSDGMPGGYEYNQNEMNIQWLMTGMTESADYYEGNDALHKLVTGMWKYYWDALTTSHPSYNAYTPVATGNFNAQDDNLSYGLRFSLDSVKFRLEYSF